MSGRPHREAARVSAIVLAAGRSTRYGRLKALEPWRGESLVMRAVRASAGAGASEVLVVVGHRADEVAAAVERAPGLGALSSPVRVLRNEDYAEGQSTSVRLGIRSARGDLAVVLPIDQPELHSDVIERLVERWRAGRARLVVPEVAGGLRAPVLLDRTVFSAVERLRGDAGFRQLFGELSGEIERVPFADSRPFLDIDTTGDWAALGKQA